MLLERIDIDSHGSLERVQLGPFSHRLNAIYGGSGTGKTATLDFVRSVMLGADRYWHQGCAGRVVWSGCDGLLHCRREADGTSHGRLLVDAVDRNGHSRHHDHGYRTPENYDRLDSLFELPRPAIDALVVPSAETTMEAILRACQTLHIDADQPVRDEAEITRVQSQVADLRHRLGDPPLSTETRATLESRRLKLVRRLAELEVVPTRPVETYRIGNSRRQRLEVRLVDARDEVTRLRRQELDLRRTLGEIERELNSDRLQRDRDSSMRIASTHRSELETLDNQLTRLGRTLREIRAIRDYKIRDYHVAGQTAAETTTDVDYRARLESAYHHLDWLMRDHGTRAYAVPVYQSDIESLLLTLRGLIKAVSGRDDTIASTRIDEDHLLRCEVKLTEAMRHLVDSRESLLQRIAGEHNVSVSSLNDAFGDWCQCHHQPHLYQWLLSDHFPPRAEDGVVLRARRGRLESERVELTDELNRTVNRLDDSVREVRSLEMRLRELPTDLPAVALPNAERHEYGRLRDALRNELRNELRIVEQQLQRFDSRYRLEEELRAAQVRLETLLAGTRRTSELRERARYWLDRMSAGYVGSTESKGNLSKTALRMAAAELLRRRGTQIPLLLDEPRGGEISAMLAAWSQFADAGNQLVIMTSHRGIVEGVRARGGYAQTLQSPRYYEMRYRQPWDGNQHSMGQINRELDTVWREANGFYDDPHWYRSSKPRSYDWADNYAPRNRYVNEFEVEPTSRGVRGPASPFFLTDASPVDQAPSIDAVAAQRLRSLGIHTVGQLLAADPIWISRRSELADVSPSVVARWQNEANLVCGVPQLRNFDARVLVGCGFTDPAQLARMHPGSLLEKVEAFLATDRGRQILRSGSSYELSRITSWIAAANRSVARGSRNSGGYDRDDVRGEDRRRTRRSRDRVRSVEPQSVSAYEGEQVEMERARRAREARAVQTERAQQAQRADRGEPQAGTEHEPRLRGSRRRSRREASGQSRQSTVVIRDNSHTESRDGTLKFYLHRESPIVDAPSIGAKTAQRMQAFGIHTVDQFLSMDASVIADKLGNRRIPAERVRQWQQQATLVCCIPMLRGHDAQLLVEAGISDPERLAKFEPATLLTKIDPIARSTEGKRILRGGSRPDLAEVTDWIHWSKEHRQLRAA